MNTTVTCVVQSQIKFLAALQLLEQGNMLTLLICKMLPFSILALISKYS